MEQSVLVIRSDENNFWLSDNKKVRSFVDGKVEQNESGGKQNTSGSVRW